MPLLAENSPGATGTIASPAADGLPLGGGIPPLRNGVREYVVWRTEDAAIDWFRLVEGRVDRMPAGEDGVYRSFVLPGLWLGIPPRSFVAICKWY